MGVLRASRSDRAGLRKGEKKKEDQPALRGKKGAFWRKSMQVRASTSGIGCKCKIKRRPVRYRATGLGKEDRTKQGGGDGNALTLMEISQMTNRIDRQNVSRIDKRKSTEGKENIEEQTAIQEMEEIWQPGRTRRAISPSGKANPGGKGPVSRRESKGGKRKQFMKRPE